jgi:hypothetical protein
LSVPTSKISPCRVGRFLFAHASRIAGVNVRW